MLGAVTVTLLITRPSRLAPLGQDTVAMTFIAAYWSRSEPEPPCICESPVSRWDQAGPGTHHDGPRHRRHRHPCGSDIDKLFGCASPTS